MTYTLTVATTTHTCPSSGALRPAVAALVLACLTSLAFAAAPAIAQTVATPAENGQMPDVDEIMARALERAEAQVETGIEEQVEAKVTAHVHTLDGDGAITETESTTYRIYPLGGAMYEEVIERDGRPLTEKEYRKSRKDQEEFIREVEKRKARGLDPQPDDERRVRFDRELIGRYRLTLIGADEVRGDPCWLVYFEPREGDLPERTRMDKALNRSTGRIWIAKDDYGVPRVEFDLDEPIRYLGGFLATVRETAGRVEYERVEPGVWLPTEFQLDLDIRVLVKNIRRQINRQWSDYRRVDSGSGR